MGLAAGLGVLFEGSRRKARDNAKEEAVPQPGGQRELPWVREQRCGGGGLGKRRESLEPAACKPFYHALAGTYPRAVPPGPPAQEEVTAWV